MTHPNRPILERAIAKIDAQKLMIRSQQFNINYLWVLLSRWCCWSSTIETVPSPFRSASSLLKFKGFAPAAEEIAKLERTMAKPDNKKRFIIASLPGKSVYLWVIWLLRYIESTKLSAWNGADNIAVCGLSDFLLFWTIFAVRRHEDAARRHEECWLILSQQFSMALNG